MNKDEAINHINQLYPIDSQFTDTNEVGKQLMVEAMEEVGFDWRTLPEPVLIRWAEKCLQKDEDCIRRFNAKYHG
jgi:hypothetical protein